MVTTGTKHLLIGGGLASSQALKMILMKDPGARVTLVTAEPHPPYDRPPLSKELMRGEKTADDILYDPVSFYGEKGVDVRLGTRVTAINPAAGTAILESGTARRAGGDTIAFERALIATGGTPIRPEFARVPRAGVHYLRTLDDAVAIRQEIAPGKRAAIVGGGFIGMELAASLASQNVAVTVIEAATHIWPHFLDEALARQVRDYCKARGVSFITSESVQSIRGDARADCIVTTSDTDIPCDFACIAIGIRPNTELAEACGLKVTDGIVVDGHMRTSQANVFAAGDVVNFPDPVFGIRRRVEHWGHAEYSGQVAGLNMVGADQSYDLLSYAWSDVFDMHIEAAGDHSQHDRVVHRGRFGEWPFTALYLRANRLVAYFAVNTGSREFPKLQKLIRRGVDLTGKDGELTDPDFDLKTLL